MSANETNFEQNYSCNQMEKKETRITNVAPSDINIKEENPSVGVKQEKSEKSSQILQNMEEDSKKLTSPTAPRRLTRSMTQQDERTKRVKRTQKPASASKSSIASKDELCDDKRTKTSKKNKKVYSAPTSSDSSPNAPQQESTPINAFRPISPVKELVDSQFKNLAVPTVAPQARRVSTEFATFFQQSAEEIFEKTKISNVPLMLVRLGSWKHQAHFCGELVASFNFHAKMLTWEIFLPPLIYKVEVPFSSICGLGFASPPEGSSILIIELSQAPNLLVAHFAPHAPLAWRPANDFTGGHIKLITRHALIAPKGSFNQTLEYMLKTDERLALLASQGLKPHFNRYFARENSPKLRPEFDFSSLGDSSDVESSGAKTEDGDDHEPLSDCAKHVFARLPADILAQACHRWDTGSFNCSCGETIPWRKLLSSKTCICGVTYYYSFCMECVAPTDLVWHCHDCGSCKESTVKHCRECNTCTPTQKDGSCSACSFLCSDTSALHSLPLDFQNLGMAPAQSNLHVSTEVIAKGNSFINPKQLHPQGHHAFYAYEPDTK